MNRLPYDLSHANRHNYIGSLGAAALAAALSLGGTLHSLNLSNNTLGDEGAVPIVRTLKSTSAIRELHLHDVEFGPTAAQEVFLATDGPPC